MAAFGEAGELPGEAGMTALDRAGVDTPGEAGVTAPGEAHGKLVSRSRGLERRPRAR